MSNVSVQRKYNIVVSQCTSLSNFAFSDVIDSLKSATVGVFTPQKSENITDQAFLSCPKSIIKHLPAHSCLQ